MCSATIRNLHGLSKPPIAGAIASLVGLQRLYRCKQRIKKPGVFTSLWVHRRSRQSISELSDAIGRCLTSRLVGDDACRGNGRSHLLQVKPASARRLWSMPLRGVLRRMGTFELLEGSAWN